MLYFVNTLKKVSIYQSGETQTEWKPAEVSLSSSTHEHRQPWWLPVSEKTFQAAGKKGTKSKVAHKGDAVQEDSMKEIFGGLTTKQPVLLRVLCSNHSRGP